MTDFGRDLSRVDARLREASAVSVADGPDAVTRVVHLHLQRAGLTGRPEAYDTVAHVADRALDVIGPWPDLCLLRADLHVRLHRAGEARRELGRDPAVLTCTQGRAVLADISLQEGEVEQAEALVRQLVAEERTWDHLARLAHLAAVRGDLPTADQLYVEAQDEITAKSMRSFAWVEMERGRLRLLAGEPGPAGEHYARADRAYTGHWRVQELLAELDAREGRTAEAVDRLERVLARTGRPEVSQALSPLYLRLGDPVRARRHRDGAMAAFLASARRGEVHYLHHLAQLAEPPAAVRWAHRDRELRPNPLTRSARALALLRADLPAEAEAEMTRALATGLRDPRLLERAAEVFGRDAADWPTTVLSVGGVP